MRHWLTLVLTLLAVAGSCRAASEPGDAARLDDRTGLLFDPVDEQAALSVVKKYKGEFERGNDLPGAPVVMVSLYLAAVDDDEVRVLTKLPYLRSLRLHACHHFTIVGLREIARMKQLRELDLGYCQQFRDADLKELPEGLQLCKQLTKDGVRALQAALPECSITPP